MLRESPERSGIPRQPSEPDDRPRGERHGDADGDRAVEARSRRVHSIQTNIGQRTNFVETDSPSARPGGHTAVAIAPEHREGARKRYRDVREQHAADRSAPRGAPPRSSARRAPRAAHSVRPSSTSISERATRTTHRREAHANGTRRDDELRRIHVSLLLLEDRIVERRIRRVAVEHGFGRRHIGEAHVPREKALCCAQRDGTAMTSHGEEHESHGPEAGARRSPWPGPGAGSVGGRPHHLMMATIPEVVCTRMR